MTGSKRLVRGNDTWELRVYLGRDDTGRVRHEHRTFRGTKREADRALARMVAEADSQPVPGASGERRGFDKATTVNDAIAAWRDNGWADLSPKTIRGYEEIWYHYVESTIGRRKIATLSPYEVEKFLRLLKNGGAGRDTVRRVKALLNRACRLAARWSGGAIANPIADTELPTWSINESGAPVRAPSVSEVSALLAAAEAEGIRFASFLRVVATAGMRRGEACALRWSDVDFDTATIRIDESIVAAKGGALVKAPKTRASIRTVAIDEVTVARLRTLRQDQGSLAASCEIALDDHDFVFAAEPPFDEPPHPDAMTHSFARVRTLATVASDVHLHSLRHFHATVLDPVISEAQKQARLGWSTVQMARHYTDAVPEEDRRAAKHVGRLLAEEADSTRSPKTA